MLKTIAKNAGDIIMEIYDKHIVVESKENNSPVTQADKKANTYIMQELNHHFPNIPIISEEIENKSYESRKLWTEYFIVDPLDGTKEFIKNAGEFTVNIAYISAKIRLGVVYAPALKRMYYSDGNKSYRDNTPISVNDTFETLTVVVSKSHCNEATKSFIKRLPQPTRVKQIGSSLKICAVAEGAADMYPRFGPTMEWDTAAAHIILEHSGGVLVNAYTGDSLEYNKKSLKNPLFIARPAHLQVD